MNKGRFKFEKLTKYPHMKPLDIEVWERLIDKFFDAFERVDYDVHIGDGADFLPTGDKTPAERANRIYQRKIDVVGYIGHETWIIEVKPEADMATLGQILTYGHICDQSKELGMAPKLAVVCGKVSDTMKYAYQRHEIEVIVV